MKKALSVSTRCYEQGSNVYEQLLVNGNVITEWNIITEMVFDSLWDLLEGMGYDTSDVAEVNFCPYAYTYYEKYAV